MPENQVQGKQSQVSWAKGEEGESKNQQNCENQLRWGEEEEGDGKQGDGVSWQEWKQQESDDQTVPGSLPCEEENEEDKDQLVPSSAALPSIRCKNRKIEENAQQLLAVQHIVAGLDNKFKKNNKIKIIKKI